MGRRRPCDVGPSLCNIAKDVRQPQKLKKKKKRKKLPKARKTENAEDGGQRCTRDVAPGAEQERGVALGFQTLLRL